MNCTINKHITGFLVLSASASISFANNPEIEPGPWCPDKRDHKATYKLGTLNGGGDFNIYFDYQVSWEVRLCGEVLEYRYLKFILKSRPQNQIIPNGTASNTGAVFPAGSKWSIGDILSTTAPQTDKMQIGNVVVNTNLFPYIQNTGPLPANVTDTAESIVWYAGGQAAPAPNKISPRIEIIGTTLDYTDSGHGYHFTVVDSNGQVLINNAFVVGQGLNIKNPPKPPAE